MAEILQELKKKGGGGAPNETVLWTNSAPGSYADSFNITLSQSIVNFDEIRFYYATATTTISNIYSIDIDIDLLQNSVATSRKPRSYLGCFYEGGSYARSITYTDDTHLVLYNANKLYEAVTNPYLCIPTQICGIKY